MKTTYRIGWLSNVVLLGSALVLAGASCGTSNDAATRRGLTLDNACETLAKEFCPIVEPCCESNGLVYFPKGCEAEQLEGCGEEVATVKAGRAIFDAEAAETCMAKAGSIVQKCRLETDEELAEWAEWDAVCKSVFKGAKAEGESCKADRDCIQPSDTAKRARCRSEKCVIETARAGEGEACSASQFIRCKDGLYCRTPSYGQPDGLCEKVRAIGEACDFPSQCESAGYCDNFGGVCVSKKAVGEACSSSLECGIYWCIEGKCAAMPLVNDAACNGGLYAEDPGGPNPSPQPLSR